MTAPHAAITFHPESNTYGFRVYWPGQRPHYQMDTFASPEAALQWLDPQNEREWECPDPPEPGIVMLSTAYRPGSVPARV